MDRARLRILLLSGLDVAVGAALLCLVLEWTNLARGRLLSANVETLLVLVVFLLVPCGLAAAFLLGWGTGPKRTRRQVLQGRASCAFLFVCWLAVTPVVLFWGAILIGATEPWPLSLSQGPDTDRARHGFRRLFGHAPGRAVTALYFFSFNVRDATYYIRFRYADSAAVSRIVAARDLVRVPAETRSDARFDLRARPNHLSWWDPDEIQAGTKIYVDRPTSEMISGTRPWRSFVRGTRTMWVDRRTRTVFYRELEF